MRLFDTHYPPIPWPSTPRRRQWQAWVRPGPPASRGWEAKAYWREHYAAGYSIFWLLASLKAFWNITVYRLFRPHVRSRLWWH